ncbi:MAG: hypothetical protein KGQ58_00375 [Proteobacteria bacterium]|nr:hypothetical protein [Pseudomonadota bacterium]MDE3208941.1 hypothetical protein [Pseudomonadota bacterium]
MAEYSIQPLKLAKRLACFARQLVLCCLLCCMMSGNTWASGMQDPTQPPFSAYGGMQAGENSLPRLQSIKRAPDYLGAMLDGQMVQLGGYDGEWRLVHVGEGSVVVLRNGERHKLSLYPKLSGLKRQEKTLLGSKAK